MWITYSASAPASEGSTSDCTPDFEPLAEALARSAWWRGKPFASRTWLRRCKRGDWISLLSGVEISPSSRPPIFPGSIGTPAAFHASPSAQPASGPGSTIPDTCGPPSESRSGSFGLWESFLKTSPDICRSVSAMSSKTWRDLVSAVRSACTQRRKSAPRTDGNESLSSAWPTPAARDWKDGPGMSQDRPDRPSGRLDTLPRLVFNVDGTNGRADPEKTSTTGNRRAQLNPDWVETLMGFPPGWTDCGRWETLSSPNRPNTLSSDCGSS